MVRSYLGRNSAFEQFQYLEKTSFAILTDNTASVKTEVHEKLSEGSNWLSMLVKKDETKLPNFAVDIHIATILSLASYNQVTVPGKRDT